MLQGDQTRRYNRVNTGVIAESKPLTAVLSRSFFIQGMHDIEIILTGKILLILMLII